MRLSSLSGVPCSERSERLIAFSYLHAPERAVAHARCLLDDGSGGAVRLAEFLTALPGDKAEQLVRRFLRLGRRL